jgi:hypothetical protein
MYCSPTEGVEEEEEEEEEEFIHFITVHIIRIKPFIDTVKKSSKKNIYYVSYFMSAYIV